VHNFRLFVYGYLQIFSANASVSDDMPVLMLAYHYMDTVAKLNKDSKTYCESCFNTRCMALAVEEDPHTITFKSFHGERVGAINTRFTLLKVRSGSRRLGVL
jgi:hypothetical protein